ncbi:sulfite exporter TauE/SafE family protein [Ammoniphilus sp. CFH 90114]|uniref:sulfite exporter TauE/SafE family protein n=1 Tax=Ammoniphilus sp. CFH 90114 TaxID=2493665 RepID=UPI0013E9552C|nr:sulfite exporter TauE/SafE family protein [Ammoniphilus sp. CFH 90114]
MEHILYLIGALAAGIIKGGFGIGAGILPVAFLSLFLPPDRVIVMLYPAMLMTTLFSLIPYWGKWDLSILKLFIPASLIGTWIGVSILALTPGNILRIVLGLLALTFVWNEWNRKRKKTTLPEDHIRPWWESGLAGIFGGMASSLAHAGGMVFSMYLVRLGLTKERFVATLIIAFTISDIMKGFFYSQLDMLQLVDLYTLITTALAGLIGVVGGTWLQRSISLERFQVVILGLISISGLILIGSVFNSL